MYLGLRQRQGFWSCASRSRINVGSAASAPRRRVLALSPGESRQRKGAGAFASVTNICAAWGSDVPARIWYVPPVSGAHKVGI
jgi:hypothetical protein